MRWLGRRAGAAAATAEAENWTSRPPPESVAGLPRLIIQIPCLDEGKTLPVTLAELPRQIPGVGTIETLIIDDGSSDRTVEVARARRVDHVVHFTAHRGLAKAFMAGLDACLQRGADIIVNTDGDNQYCAADIPLLVAPLVAGEADMVVGCRPIEDIAHFSWLKKRLQRWGSRTVHRLSGIDVPDATSGFRAFNREAALRLNVISDFTYTIETLIQAGKKDIVTRWVPVRVNSKLRESRLFKSLWDYLRRAVPGMLRIYATYEPLKVFATLGVLVLTAGVLPILRFLYFFAIGQGGGHVQSLVLGSALALLGFQIMVLGLLADLNAANRRLTEDVLYRMRRGEIPPSEPPGEKGEPSGPPFGKEGHGGIS
jgi:glycosyltransferase involved in cell wall biosynthesis